MSFPILRLPIADYLIFLWAIENWQSAMPKTPRCQQRGAFFKPD